MGLCPHSLGRKILMFYFKIYQKICLYDILPSFTVFYLHNEPYPNKMCFSIVLDPLAHFRRITFQIFSNRHTYLNPCRIIPKTSKTKINLAVLLLGIDKCVLRLVRQVSVYCDCFEYTSCPTSSMVCAEVRKV